MIALVTMFVLVLLLLLEGHKLRNGILKMMSPARAERTSRIAGEVSRSVTGYMIGNFITSLIAGIVVFVALTTLGVPFALLWALSLIHISVDEHERDRKSTRLNSSHPSRSRMPSSA